MTRACMALLLVMLSGLGFGDAFAVEIPMAARQYRAELIRNARAVWGLDAPVATFAAQIYQESGWRSDAMSRVGAQGLTQFMPTTSKWIAGLYPQSVGSAQPFNPSWSMRALVQYDRWLFDRIAAANPCERLAFTLSAYNGGLSWVNRDKKLATRKGLDRLTWFDAVATVNSGRSAANWRENRTYPQRILKRYESQYVAAHWGEGGCNE